MKFLTDVVEKTNFWDWFNKPFFKSTLTNLQGISVLLIIVLVMFMIWKYIVKPNLRVYRRKRY